MKDPGKLLRGPGNWHDNESWKDTPGLDPREVSAAVENLQEQTDALVEGASALKSALGEVAGRLQAEALEKRVAQLENVLAELLERREFVLPLHSLEPEPYTLNRPIDVLLTGDGGGFTATFVE